jgi:hypothetical protein
MVTLYQFSKKKSFLENPKIKTCDMVTLYQFSKKKSFVAQVKEISYHDFSPINSFLQYLRYFNVYTKSLMCSFRVVSMPFGVSKGKALLFLS